MGLWNEKATKFNSFKMFSYIFLTLVFIIMGGLYLINAKDLIDFIDAVTICPSLIGSFVRVLILVREKPKIEDCLNQLKDLIIDNRWNDNQKALKLSNRVIKIEKTFKTIFSMVVFSFAATFFVPFFSHELPYKFWFPFDYNQSKVLFWSSVTFESVGGLVMSPVIVIVGNLPVFFIVFLTGVVEELSIKLKSISSNNQTGTDDKNLQELLKCVQIHHKIKIVAAGVTDVFGTTIWMECLMSVLALCTAAFTMTVVEDNAVFGRVFALIVPMVLFILLPCHFGNELIWASGELSSSLFHGNWINQSKEFKIVMKIFMENLKNPVKISAFGVFDLSLQTFLKIVNSTYTYYAVLRNVNE